MMTSGKAGVEKMYSGVFDCASKIYQNEGPRAFFKGCLSKQIQCVGSALLLVFYDKIKTALL